MSTWSYTKYPVETHRIKFDPGQTPEKSSSWLYIDDPFLIHSEANTPATTYNKQSEKDGLNTLFDLHHASTRSNMIFHAFIPYLLVVFIDNAPNYSNMLVACKSWLVMKVKHSSLPHNYILIFFNGQNKIS